jgi:L-ascorbate metabolism protein UlaG (beta-lactamase superfamily)
VTVSPGESYEIDGLSIETVPAYNLLKPFHPKSAEWVGYIVKDGGKRIYICGDTDATKEAKAVQCDIALVPIGGTYTMDAKKAAEFVNELQPKVVIPVHYGTVVGKPADGEVFKKHVKDPVVVEFKITF